MINIGAAFASTTGFGQFLALQQLQNGICINPDTANGARFKFGIGMTSSKGTVQVKSLIGVLSFHVVDANTPFLLLLYDLNSLGVYYNNLSNTLVGKNTTWPVVCKFGHLFLIWEKPLSMFYTTIFHNRDNVPIEGQLTEVELQ